MSGQRQIDGEIHSKAGMKRVFVEIGRDVEVVKSQPALTEFYKRAGYLITLTHAPSRAQKFANDAAARRDIGENRFRKTAHKINRRAVRIGAAADSDEIWGSG